jgi:protein phosphatase
MKNSKRNEGHYAFKTDVGKVRLSNEDQSAIFSNADGDILMLVCDGMGGHNKGDYASKMAVELMSDAFASKAHFRSTFMTKYWLKNTVKNINSRIYDEGYKNPMYHDMGTTLVALLIIRDQIFVANVGDSRAYELKYDVLAQLTEDQTYVDYLYRAGKITKEEESSHPKRHVLLNALGIFPSLNVEIFVLPYIGNSILLCSDGLYNNVTDKEILSILNTDDRVEQKVDLLIRLANTNGGSDNIAIAYWEINK